MSRHLIVVSLLLQCVLLSLSCSKTPSSSGDDAVDRLNVQACVQKRGRQICMVSNVQQCVDTNIDSKNCGGCGKDCNTNSQVAQKCSAGQCVPVCATNHVYCVDTCILANTVDNCGGCGATNPDHKCAVGQQCINGVCSCPTGQFSCNGVCVNQSNGDDFNCGSCNTICPDTQTCVNGVCTACTTLNANCVSCDEGKCSGCGTGYGLTSDGSCALCGSSACLYCPAANNYNCSTTP